MDFKFRRGNSDSYSFSLPERVFSRASSVTLYFSGMVPEYFSNATQENGFDLWRPRGLELPPTGMKISGVNTYQSTSFRVKIDLDVPLEVRPPIYGFGGPVFAGYEEGFCVGEQEDQVCYPVTFEVENVGNWSISNFCYPQEGTS